MMGEGNTLARGCQLYPRDGNFEGVRIVIGSGCGFNRGVYLDANGRIEIGNEVSVGPDVYITDSNHSTTTSSNRRVSPMEVGRVVIGDRCWIGAKAVILKDVTLGEYCVVAAGAVVTKSFPARSLVAGVPARLIKSLPEAASTT
jgi:acetyltransferase-like isoleucine patch superfamily enzyme